MESLAVIFERPGQLAVRPLALVSSSPAEVLVDVEWTGISTGTERLLYTGEMPPFPGLEYPLVPGYETIGRVAEADPDGAFAVGDRVFVPGASCFGEVRGLFGGAASRLRVAASRVTKIDPDLGERGVLLALASTAQHALAGGDRLPDVVVGHGVLGRLLARLIVAAGGTPTVWETRASRRAGDHGYRVVHPDEDERRDYRCICDASGDHDIVDALLPRLAKGGEIVLAGFYGSRMSFAFPFAFMKEARLRVAAEWAPADLSVVLAHLSNTDLTLDGLVTHQRTFEEAEDAYACAFEDPDCLKMVLDWRSCQ